MTVGADSRKLGTAVREVDGGGQSPRKGQTEATRTMLDLQAAAAPTAVDISRSPREALRRDRIDRCGQDRDARLGARAKRDPLRAAGRAWQGIPTHVSSAARNWKCPPPARDPRAIVGMPAPHYSRPGAGHGRDPRGRVADEHAPNGTRRRRRPTARMRDRRAIFSTFRDFRQPCAHQASREGASPR
jgi:hypothetical protein